MVSSPNRELVMRFYQRFDKGELDEIDASVGAEFVANVLGTTSLDWSGFKQFAETFKIAFPDGKHVFDVIVGDGENIVTIGTYEGTHTGKMNDIPASNKGLKLPVMHLDRVVNGQIVEHRGLANESDLMRQLEIT